MTFTEILAAVYDETGYQTSPASAIVTRVKRFVNEGLHAIVSEPGLARLLDSDSPATFASVANQARYVLTESVNRILVVSERTNDYALEVMGLDRYRRMDPDPTVTGTPTHLVPIGRVAVAVQPSAATELFVDSTAAGDTNTAFVEGLITGGYRRTTSNAMTGITEVTVGSTITTFTEVEDFYLSANAVGTVTLWQGTTGTPPTLTTELARITIGQKRPRYYGVYLWPTPAAAVTYYVDYRRELTELVNDTDEPPISLDAHPALVAYAVMREREQKEDLERFVIAKARYDKIVSRLKYATQTIGGEIPVSGRAAVTGHSRLGEQYPADSWR